MSTEPIASVSAEAVRTAYENARTLPLRFGPVEPSATSPWREQDRVYGMLADLGIEVVEP